MSAITAVFHREEQYDVKTDGSNLMESLSVHPCNSAYAWSKQNVFLGCHNQWITPESVGERNPYYDAERGLVITADAIIDNRAELFEELGIENGLRKEITDTELILLSYVKWRDNSPKHLIGDFSFIIWDEKEHKLFACRDFSGTRTLYYHWDGTRIAICTIIEPLLKLPEVERSLNEGWLAQYLAINVAIPAVDSATTVYNNIWQLPASHSLTVVKGELKVTSYSVLDNVSKTRFKTDEQYVEAFQEIFQRAVNDRLRTHRGVGSQLSGGLDSGSVVAYAARSLNYTNRKLHTFSYIPPEDFIDFTPRYNVANESPYIQKTVEYIGGIDAHYLDFKDRNSYIDIDTNLDLLEMPYKNFMNTFWVRGIYEKAAEQDIGILLSGGRGNMTVSWGFAIEGYSLLLKQLRWLRLLKEIKVYSLRMGTGRKRVLSSILNASFPLLSRNKKEVDIKPESIIRSDFAEKTKVYELLRQHGLDESSSFLENNIYKFRWWHFREPFHWNSTNTLATKLSLANNILGRDPTNDIRTIRYCLSVPEDQYVLDGYSRALIRRSTDGMLPDEVRLNQHVRGSQGEDWLHRIKPHWDTFINEAEEMSQNARLLQYIDKSKLDKALSQYKAREAQPDQASDDNLRILMWCLILNRFMNRKL